MKILFITSNRLGDAVLTTGLLGHLVDAHPDARFTVVVGPIAAPLFRAVPRLERLIPLAKRSWGRHWLDLWRQVGGVRWDLIIDLRDTPLSRVLPARRRAVLRTPDTERHKVATLGQAFGLASPPPPRLWLDAAAQAFADGAVPAGRPVLAVAPAANWTGKEWPADRFADAADRLTGRGGLLEGGTTLVLGAAGEAPRCRHVLDRLGGRAIDLVGRTDAAEAAACIARCALFVGNDSGLMHVAAAAGVPTLGLFGPTPAEVYAPWGTQARAVQAPGAAGGRALSDLTVEAVLGEAASLIAPSAPRTAEA